MPTICRDCLQQVEPAKRCPSCGSPRLISHPELFKLSIAHMDCDAFYASVEKRDRPELRDKPVIIGGGERGVVSTACYIARIKGVRSAMPMFQARKICPEAVVVPPRMSAYVAASKEIRTFMDALSPAVEPLSLDEAFIDLTGTEKLHKEPPALCMARLVKRMEDELGLSGSVGLSYNKFLAKMASDFEKPRGFSVLGQANIREVLAPKPVKLIWGVGEVGQKNLAQDGIYTFKDIQTRERKSLIESYGQMGDRLWHLARGEDYRDVKPRQSAKGISNETTFRTDISDPQKLDGYLWRMSEKVADRAKSSGIAGKTVTLKVKTAKHKIITRRTTLREATQTAQRIYEAAKPLLADVLQDAPFRLLGSGLAQIEAASGADQSHDLLEQEMAQKTKTERATDAIRERFGSDAIIRGRALK